MFRKIKDQLIARIQVHCNRVPMRFVHVKAGIDRIVLLAQLNGPLRVAFEVDTGEILHIAERKHFTVDLEHQGALVKREMFRNTRKFQTIVVEIFYVHFL